jgi:hypothetical protein
MFSAISGFVGSQPFNDWFAPDTVARHVVGTTIYAVDPFWGAGKFVYTKSADAVVKGSVVMWDESFNLTLLPSAVTQGFCFGVAMAPMASGTYGWIQTEGRAVYVTNATVAADGVLAVAAAGTLGATATGKQVLGIRNRVSATGTKTNTATMQAGQNKFVCTNGYDGFFLGMTVSLVSYLSAATVISGLDQDGKTVYIGTAIGTSSGKNTLLTGSGLTITGTYTGYGSGVINNPSCLQIVT